MPSVHDRHQRRSFGDLARTPAPEMSLQYRQVLYCHNVLCLRNRLREEIGGTAHHTTAQDLDVEISVKWSRAEVCNRRFFTSRGLQPSRKVFWNALVTRPGTLRFGSNQAKQRAGCCARFSCADNPPRLIKNKQSLKAQSGRVPDHTIDSILRLLGRGCHRMSPALIWDSRDGTHSQ